MSSPAKVTIDRGDTPESLRSYTGAHALNARVDAQPLVFEGSAHTNGGVVRTKIPNELTRRTFRDTDAGVDLHESRGLDDLVRQLDETQ